MEHRLSDIPTEMYELIQDKLRSFNLSRTSGEGLYLILLPTDKSLYYTLWFYNPSAVYYPYVYLSNLELNALGSIRKAIRLMANSYLPLHITDSIDNLLKHGDDIILFGKYRGRHLQDIFMIDPHYINWIAEKYEPKVKSEYRFKELAETYSKAFRDQQTQRKYKTQTSQFVGKPGEKLDELLLIITRVRVEDDSFQTHISNGIEYFYVDQLLTAIDSAGNQYLITVKATDRSLASRSLSPGTHVFKVGENLFLESAKVLKHVEYHNTKYTKLGYVKMSKT